MIIEMKYQTVEMNEEQNHESFKEALNLKFIVKTGWGITTHGLYDVRL